MLNDEVNNVYKPRRRCTWSLEPGARSGATGDAVPFRPLQDNVNVQHHDPSGLNMLHGTSDTTYRSDVKSMGVNQSSIQHVSLLICITVTPNIYYVSTIHPSTRTAELQLVLS
jgi:hypothetical protein